MPRRFTLGLCAAAIALLPAQAAGTVPLGESEFLSLAAGEPRVAVLLDAPVRAAAGEARRSSAWSNPVAEVERESPGDGRQQTTWTLSFSPPLGPRRGALQAAARAGVDAAAHERAWAALERREEARAAFADWAISAERTAASGELLDRTRQILAMLAERAGAGEESGFSHSRLRLAAVEIEAQVATAAAELIRAHKRAQVWLGDERECEPSLPPLPLPGGTDSPEPHPLLGALQAETDRAGHLVRASRRLDLAPELSVGFQRIREPGLQAEGLLLGGRIGLPLFDRRQGDRMEAIGRQAAAQALLELEATRLESRRVGARAAYMRLREAALASGSTVEASESVIRGATDRFEMGEGDLTELLETMRGVLASRMAFLDLYASALEAHRDLELATGRPLEEERR